MRSPASVLQTQSTGFLIVALLWLAGLEHTLAALGWPVRDLQFQIMRQSNYREFFAAGARTNASILGPLFTAFLLFIAGVGVLLWSLPKTHSMDS
jgi:hypothetical protein